MNAPPIYVVEVCDLGEWREIGRCARPVQLRPLIREAYSQCYDRDLSILVRRIDEQQDHSTSS